ncbi:MAG: hypothetical protein J6039_05905 [Alphaproteobacteria bacterium]|nr:hypothetical protein [Alphaproteobacteria bacterium]
MTYTTPDHYSYKFKFDIEHLPAKRVDKISSNLTVCGIIFGMLFFILGAFELISYLLNESNESYDFIHSPGGMSARSLFVFRYSFDSFILVFGLLIVALSVMAMMRRKTIFFDGENIRIEHKPLFGGIKTETETLYNYLGVLLKVEYYQLGLINRNRYIIELYHKEKNKRVPLYISTNGDEIRKIWEYYAEKLKMPALFMTDHGLVSRHYKELNKTLKDMSKRWHIDALYNEEENAPGSLKYKAKPNKVILKERRWFFDVYTILAILGAIMLGFLFLYSAINYRAVVYHIGAGWYIGLMLFLLLVILFISVSIFCKDVLIITPDELVLGHNVMFLRMDTAFIPKKDIESVDVGHNPITDRYYLSIISHKQSVVFGKNMPIEDLRWLRGCVIREVVK